MFASVKTPFSRLFALASRSPYMLAFILLAVTYVAEYLTYGPVPGNNIDWPLGWWGWADQGLYLRSSVALSNSDFSSSEHFYMPLYPFIGSLLINITPNHSYLLPNILLISVFSAMTIKLTSRYLEPWVVVICLVAGTFLFQPLRLQWVIPWTSTLSATLMVAALYLLDRYFSLRKAGLTSPRQFALNALLFGAALGAVAATRAVDLLIMLPVGMFYAYFAISDLFRSRELRLSGLVTIFFGAFGFCPCVMAWLWFNLEVYGDMFGGPYFSAAESFGFFPSTLHLKLYSHLLDSFSLYGEPNQDWLSQMPFFVFALAFVPASLLAPIPLIFKVFAICLFFQFGVYYSYSDILPTGTFRYNNIHYFKWLMPLLLACVVLVVRSVKENQKDHRRNAKLACAFAGLLLVGGMAVKLDHRVLTVGLIEESERRALISLPKNEIQYIDITATSDNWVDIYFAQGFKLELDGNPIRMPRDYHPFPIPGGMRIVFVRPITGQQLSIDVGDKVQFIEPLQSHITAGNLQFGFGIRSKDMKYSPINPGTILDFSTNHSVGRFLSDDWSVGEEWGRWIDGDAATVRLKVPSGDKDDLFFRITAGGFVTDKHPQTITEIRVNGCIIGRIVFSGSNMSDHDFRVPRPCVSSSGNFELEFRNLNAISPQKLGISNDRRNLGIGVSSFHLM